jgi:hypothetical protein
VVLRTTSYNNLVYSNDINDPAGSTVYLGMIAYNNSVYSNNITSTGNAVELSSISYNNSVYSNNMTSTGHGVLLSSTAYNNLVYSNSITTTSSSNAYGIYLLTDAHDNNFINNNITTASTSVYMNGATTPVYKNLFANSTITNGSALNIYSTQNAQNNTFLNVSLNKSRITFGASGDNNLTIQWYARVNVTGIGDAPLEDAIVNVSDAYGTAKMSDTQTDANGLTGYIIVTERYMNSTDNYTFNSHAINVSYGYGFNETSFNVLSTVTINITVYRYLLDISFTVTLPASGCTNGKGCTGGGCPACARAWIETTDLTGAANQACVMPEGQTAGTAFLNFTNTGNVNLNWTMKLNASLSSQYALNVSNGTDSCAGSQQLSTAFITIQGDIPIGDSAYGWLYGEFINALYGSETRELNHTSEQS